MTKTLFIALAIFATATTNTYAHSDHAHNIGDHFLSETESAHLNNTALNGKATVESTYIEHDVFQSGVKVPTIYGVNKMAKPLTAEEAAAFAADAKKERKAAMKALKQAQKHKKLSAKEAYAALTAEQKIAVDAQWAKARKAAIAKKEAEAAKIAAEKARVEARMAAAKEKLPMKKAGCKDCLKGKKCKKCLHSGKKCQDCAHGKMCKKCLHKKHKHTHNTDKHNHRHSHDIPFANDVELLKEAM